MIKVFVAEDSAILRKEIILTTPWLQLNCQVVGEEGNGVLAEEKIRKLKPDIVITDIRLPGQTGLEMIKQLQDVQAIEYIVISAYSEFDFAFNAIRLNVGNYLLKPLDDQELIQAIKAAVDRIQENRVINAMRQDINEIIDNNALAFNNFEKDLFPIASPYLKRALNYVEENLGDYLSLTGVADYLKISSSYLSKIFRKELDTSFNEYLTYRRIQRAAFLMRESDKKIYEVSEEVGYSDYRYFSTQFKKLMGVSASEYKTMNHPRSKPST